MKYIGNTKLSPVAREIHPYITNSFKDNYIFEFLGLEKYTITVLKNIYKDISMNIIFGSIDAI